jgi:hypothetical protein
MLALQVTVPAGMPLTFVGPVQLMSTGEFTVPWLGIEATAKVKEGESGSVALRETV